VKGDKKTKKIQKCLTENYFVATKWKGALRTRGGILNSRVQTNHKQEGREKKGGKKGKMSPLAKKNEKKHCSKKNKRACTFGGLPQQVEGTDEHWGNTGRKKVEETNRSQKEKKRKKATLACTFFRIGIEWERGERGGIQPNGGGRGEAGVEDAA